MDDGRRPEAPRAVPTVAGEDAARAARVESERAAVSIRANTLMQAVRVC